MRAGMTGGGMRMGLMGMACGLVAVVTVAEAGPPARSANPGNVAIFPARGQTPDQQRQDESAAYDWATQQTGWDPYQAQALLGQQEQAATAAGPLPVTRDRSTPSSRASRRTDGPAGSTAVATAARTDTGSGSDSNAAGAAVRWPFSTTGAAARTGSNTGCGAGSAAGLAGAAAAGLGAASTIEPSSTRVSPTLTVSPFLTNPFSTKPPGGQGTSITALSVSTSSRGWPGFTTSPSETKTVTTSPEAMFSPRSGSLNSVAMTSATGNWGTIQKS